MSDSTGPGSVGPQWPPQRVVLATANPGKTEELAEMLATLCEVVPRPDGLPDVVEDADSLVGNARLKARALCDATGMVALADDTGLEVDALDGAPGVHSARYAGCGGDPVANMAKLLDELAGLAGKGDVAGSPGGWRARFRTVLMLAHPDGREMVTNGVVEGVIVEAPRGSSGFGYDPVFAPSEGDGRTFSEMSLAEKQVLSHRGAALRSLIVALGGQF